MNRIGVMQIVDSLALGGLERVAVNLANSLPEEHFHSHLCVTRNGGPLEESISENVNRLDLQRTGRYDFGAIWRLRNYIRKNQIQILHAHGTSLFIAAFVSRFASRTAVVWHDHFGRVETEERPVRRYRSAAKHLSGVIAVNQRLAEWSRRELDVAQERVWYIPNFVREPNPNLNVPELPGRDGARIVCVANFRPEKDHLNLFHAMKMVVRSVPEAHLILVGNGQENVGKIDHALTLLRLKNHVTRLGERKDVPAILRGCEIGVLSSASEGLPLALIEYGMAGLPSVATNVGQCAEVLDDGRAGLLVAPGSPLALADALMALLQSPEKRAALRCEFARRVRAVYGQDIVLRQIYHVYQTILGGSPDNPSCV